MSVELRLDPKKPPMEWGPPVGRLFVQVMRSKNPDGRVSMRRASRTISMCYTIESSERVGTWLRCVNIALLVGTRASGIIMPGLLLLRRDGVETKHSVLLYRLATDRDLRLFVHRWSGTNSLAAWLHQLEHGGGPHGVPPGLAKDELERLRRIVVEIHGERA